MIPSIRAIRSVMWARSRAASVSAVIRRNPASIIPATVMPTASGHEHSGEFDCRP